MVKKLVTVLSIFVLLGCSNSGVTENAEPQNEDVTIKDETVEKETTQKIENTTENSSETGKADGELLFQTIGDIYAADTHEQEHGNIENTFYIVFDYDGVLYRAYAPMSGEVLNKLMSLDFTKDDYKERYREIAGELEITKLDNLTDIIPTLEELDAWIGKTGRDLLEDGFEEGYGYSLDNMTFSLVRGPVSYLVKFESDETHDESTEIDVEKTISDLVIEWITYSTLEAPEIVE